MDSLDPHHWRIDGQAVGTPTAQKLRALLANLVSVTGLTELGPPQVDVRNPDWQALQMIAESHISAHGRESRGFIDVFSCRAFDADAALGAVCQVLGGEWEAERIDR